MLEEINVLNPDTAALRRRSGADGESSSDAESIDGLSDGEGPGFLVSPSCIPPYHRPPPPDQKWTGETWKNHVLIEYFAGWAVAYADCHRRFVAITTISDNVDSKWGHVCTAYKGLQLC
jgi:hypothetical protein